ncbi:MAG TPA: hypothetical protein DD400_01345 [Rhodospirillaceae bacterium]|nr:hypothetical protein [Rhodospirillaceae bacterium]
MKKFLTSCLVLLLVACTHEPAPQPIQLNYASLSKIYLDARDLRIIDRSKATTHWNPYVGHLFSPTLTEATHNLAAARIQTTGHLGHATFIIKDANIAEQPLEISSDLSSLFTRQQASKYIGRLEVSLEAQSSVDGSLGTASAVAVHAVTLPENPSAYEKQEAYRTLLTSLMATLNKNLDKAIKKHLSRFLLSGPYGKRKDPFVSLISPTTDSEIPRRTPSVGQGMRQD